MSENSLIPNLNLDLNQYPVIKKLAALDLKTFDLYVASWWCSLKQYYDPSCVVEIDTNALCIKSRVLPGHDIRLGKNRSIGFFIEKGNEIGVKLLLNAGIHPGENCVCHVKKPTHEHSIFYHAIICNQFAMVKTMVERGALTADFDLSHLTRELKPEFALQTQCHIDNVNPEIIYYLIEHGVSPADPDCVFEFALKSGCDKLTLLLMTIFGFDAQHIKLALKYDRKDVVKKMIGDVRFDPKIHTSIIMDAAAKGNQQMVESLIQRGAPYRIESVSATSILLTVIHR